MDDDNSQPEDAGMPAWVMTFADLMSLLMCFFVLLLSFSEMDVQKFKQIAGSMKVAFGVQRVVRAHEIPKGTSIVAKEFSPGKPEPTLLHRVRQNTASVDNEKLSKEKQRHKKTRKDARKMASALKNEIKSGLVEIETVDSKIVIRILEKGSFGSGHARIEKSFQPAMEKIRNAIGDVHGLVIVSGHTDDMPILTNRFRSNWDLSTARAVSVVHALLEEGIIQSGRFSVNGFGATRPRVSNDTSENRAKNRRVEIVIEQGKEFEESHLNKSSKKKSKKKLKKKAKKSSKIDINKKKSTLKKSDKSKRGTNKDKAT